MKSEQDIKKARCVTLTQNEIVLLKSLTQKTGLTKAITKAIEILEKPEIQRIAFPAYTQDESSYQS